MQFQYREALLRLQYAMYVNPGQFLSKSQFLDEIRDFIKDLRHNKILALKQKNGYAYIVLTLPSNALSVALFACNEKLSGSPDELEEKLRRCKPIGFTQFEPWNSQGFLYSDFIYVDKLHRGLGYAPGLIGLAWQYSKLGITSSKDMDLMSMATFTRMARQNPKIKLFKMSEYDVFDEKKGTYVDADFPNTIPTIGGIPINKIYNKDDEIFIFVWKK